MKLRLVCLCNMVTEAEIIGFIKKGAKTTEDIQKITGAGTSCGRCLPEIDELVRKYTSSQTIDNQMKLNL